MFTIREYKMLLRGLLCCTMCFVIVGCANSNKPKSLYSSEEAYAIKAKHWLKMNLKREGVQVTDSGLQYKVLESSLGCKPDKDYKVKVHYKMLSVSSKQIIDSSYQRGYPENFKLSKMIKGWREGVPMMKVGETWEFYIPADLAYGSKGIPGSVAPNSVLVSQISLLDAHCLA